MKYRVVMTVDYEVEAENVHAAREAAIRKLREGKGDWDITYVGRKTDDDEEEVDVTDKEELP